MVRNSTKVSSAYSTSYAGLWGDDVFVAMPCFHKSSSRVPLPNAGGKFPPQRCGPTLRCTDLQNAPLSHERSHPERRSLAMSQPTSSPRVSMQRAASRARHRRSPSAGAVCHRPHLAGLGLRATWAPPAGQLQALRRDEAW